MAEPFRARPLDETDHGAAAQLAARGGAHGIYVGNFLGARAQAEEGGEVLGFYGENGLVGLAFFGSRGNLILIAAAELDPDRVASAVQASGLAWRIALGPGDAIRALAQRERRAPLVERCQLYYGVRPRDVPAARLRTDVRLAERADQHALLTAALELNQSDLHVDPRTVHRQWLKESIRRRIRAGQTHVVGLPGHPVCKLDVGSTGPLGVMVEGVYTSPAERRRGLAAGLVATVARRFAETAPLVCLHVAADNEPARRAYEHAGMAVLQSCELVLRG